MTEYQPALSEYSTLADQTVQQSIWTHCTLAASFGSQSDPFTALHDGPDLWDSELSTTRLYGFKAAFHGIDGTTSDALVVTLDVPQPSYISVSACPFCYQQSIAERAQRPRYIHALPSIFATAEVRPRSALETHVADIAGPGARSDPCHNDSFNNASRRRPDSTTQPTLYTCSRLYTGIILQRADIMADSSRVWSTTRATIPPAASPQQRSQRLYIYHHHSNSFDEYPLTPYEGMDSLLYTNGGFRQQYTEWFSPVREPIVRIVDGFLHTKSVHGALLACSPPRFPAMPCLG